MINKFSGVILAGGSATRFDGREKAFIEVGGKRIIERLLDVYRQIFDDIVIVTNNPLEYIGIDATIVPDIIDKRSSMTGVHAGLFFARNDMAFVSACDTPFLKKGMIELVLSVMKPHYDAVMPIHDNGFLEPLCAVYSRRLVKVFANSLMNEVFTIRDALAERRLITIPEEKLRKSDSALLSFFNINTAEDLDKACRMSEENQEL